MKRSNSDIAAWLESLPRADGRQSILAYVKQKTIEAFAARDTSLLPSARDIAAGAGQAGSTARQYLLELCGDGVLGRIRVGAGFRYHATADWLG